jgi:DMSO/TMAO reductase YedYZ heme-binding membrane subunit
MSDAAPPPAKAPPARPPAARPGADPALAALEAQSQVSEILSLAAGALFGAAVATALAATFVFDQPMPDDVTKIVWYGIRTAGVVAYILLWLTVISGLAISGGLFPKWGAVLLPLHQLADLALSLAVLHAALLLGDRFAGFTPETLVVPFRSSYEPLWSGLGILALYIGAVVFWSVEFRPKIGYARWRQLHYLSFVVYTLALLHGLFAGTDRNTAPMQLLYVVTGGSVMAMTVLRSVSILRKRAAPPPAERPARKPGTTQQA